MKVRTLRTTILALFSLGLFWGGALAQNFTVEADIPFAFIIENSTLPAGTYVVKEAEPNEYSISTLKGDVFVYFQAEPLDVLTPAKTSELVFNVRGDKHFLSEIWEAGELTGLSVIKGRTELKMMKKEPRKTESVKTKKK